MSAHVSLPYIFAGSTWGMHEMKTCLFKYVSMLPLKMCVAVLGEFQALFYILNYNERSILCVHANTDYFVILFSILSVILFYKLLHIDCLAHHECGSLVGNYVCVYNLIFLKGEQLLHF